LAHQVNHSKGSLKGIPASR